MAQWYVGKLGAIMLLDGLHLSLKIPSVHHSFFTATGGLIEHESLHLKTIK